MAHIQFVDELIREYLLYRGFTTTLKHFDHDTKVEKERGFRVDKIIDQILNYINNYDLNSIRELWNHFELRMFSKLEHNLTNGVKKLENSMYKLYLVNVINNGKHEKLNEFFNKMATELQNQTEWKEWFMVPFIKSPEDNPNFAVYFTKQWQDTYILSLHNFLSTVFQCMPLPTLTSFEEDAHKIRKLQEENDFLRSKVSQLIEQSSRGQRIDLTSLDMPEHSQLYDDFFVIAHEKNVETQVKTFKDLIKQIGGVSSSPSKNQKEVTTSEEKTKIKTWRNA